MTAPAHTSAAGSHPAILRAVQVYAKEGDLTQAEQDFLIAVRRADVAYLESINTANRLFGGGSWAWEATKYLAARQRNDDYSHALESYEASIDATDEVDEIELATAAE
jgi:hypothetical protein